jgi:putative transposase
LKTLITNNTKAVEGFNYEKVLEKVSSLFKLEKEYVTGKGRQQDRVQARDLLSYWCSVKLGMSITELAERLGLTRAAVSYSVKRVDKVASEGDYGLE